MLVIFLLLLAGHMAAAYYSGGGRVNIRGHSHHDEHVIQTDKGRVRGITLTAPTGKTVDAWLGIPYGKPPLGQLRFKHPQPVERWNGVRDTTTPPNSCIQGTGSLFGNFSGEAMWMANTPLSEDCLYLNVVVPKPRQRNLPVMVWIYGGGFFSGTSTLDIYDHRTLAAEENVIVVSMQYRVGSLGFLYLNTSEAPGNAGMFDQLLALKWIHDNIEKFGGDCQRVTLFGESAGAAAVGHHLLSPLSANLFQRAILESGSAITPWAAITAQKAISNGLGLAQAVNCTNDPTKIREMIDCMRRIDPNEFAVRDWTVFEGLVFPFLPVADGAFLTKNPDEILRDGTFKRTEILIGSNRDEGFPSLFYFSTEIIRREEDLTVTREQFLELLKRLDPIGSNVSQQAIETEYTTGSDPQNPRRYLDALNMIFADTQFICDINEFAQRYTETGNDVYMYRYNHRSSLNAWPQWTGVMHGEEVKFVFGGPLNPNTSFTQGERHLSRRMMHYWANFAKLGNPNSQSTSNAAQWPKFTTNQKAYLELAVNTANVGQAPRASQCSFWKETLPKLAQRG